ncbi:hypothetical protein HP420_17180, partial [Staphylococcus xylosus]|nr:hypothetical protein [Staphylococcus xylosus]
SNKKATTTEISKPTAAEQRVKQTHKTVTFKDGIIVHENATRNLSEQSVGQSSAKQNTNNSSTKSNDGILNHDEAQNSEKKTKPTKSKSTKKTYTKNRPQVNKTEKAESKIDKRTFND